MITSLMYSLSIRSYILCVIGKTIEMMIIELRMFFYDFAYNELQTVSKESKQSFYSMKSPLIVNLKGNCKVYD